MPDPVAQERVCDQGHAIYLNIDGRVPYIGYLCAGAIVRLLLASTPVFPLIHQSSSFTPYLSV